MKYLMSLFLFFTAVAVANDDDPPCTVPTPIDGQPLPGWQCRLSTCGNLKGIYFGNPIWTADKSRYEIDVIDSDPNMIVYPIALNIKDFDGLRNRDYKVFKVIADVGSESLQFDDRVLVTGFIRDLNGTIEMMIRIKDVHNNILATHTGLPLDSSRDNEILISLDNINHVMAIEFMNFQDAAPIIYPFGIATLSDVRLQYGAFGNSCHVAPTKYEMMIDDAHWHLTTNMPD